MFKPQLFSGGLHTSNMPQQWVWSRGTCRGRDEGIPGVSGIAGVSRVPRVAWVGWRAWVAGRGRGSGDGGGGLVQV